MAKEQSRLAQILSQEYKSKGAISGLTSALGKRAKEKFDPRNILFGGIGVGSKVGQKMFGKGYSAISPKKIVKEDTSSKKSDELIENFERIGVNSEIIAKKFISIPVMARDINIMKQNIIKMTNVVTKGKAVKRSEAGFRGKISEKQYEKEADKIKSDSSKKEEGKPGEEPDLMGGALKKLGELLSPKNIMSSLVFAAKAFPVTLLAASLFNGISEGWKEWEETGDLSKAALKYLSGMTFGLLSPDFFQENVITPIVDIAEKIFELISEYITTPISKAYDKVKKYLKDGVLSIMKILGKIGIPRVEVDVPKLGKIGLGPFYPFEEIASIAEDFQSMERLMESNKRTGKPAELGAAGPAAAAGAASSTPTPAPTTPPAASTSPTPPKMPTTGTTGGAAVGGTKQANLDLIEAALKEAGLTNANYITAVKANVMKESGGIPKDENLNYGGTPNDRIRKIFGSRAMAYTDDQLNEIKKDPVKMAELMYGHTTKIGQGMGNTEPGDGFKYRGRGFIQLTGKSNYMAASKAIYGDDTLVKNPDLANDPAVAAKITAWYMKKGKATFEKMLGVDANEMTQEQANLLATSQIGGKDVRKMGAYGEEVMSKVGKYSQQTGVIAGTGGTAPSIAAAPAAPAATPVAAAPSTGGAVSQASGEVAEGKRMEIAAAAPAQNVRVSPNTTNVQQTTTKQEDPQRLATSAYRRAVT